MNPLATRISYHRALGAVGRSLAFLAVLAAAVMLIGGNAWAIQIQLAAQDDTWVREDNSDSNRDGNDFMNARTDIDGDDNDVVLIRFDTAALSGETLGPNDVSLDLTWYRSDSSTNEVSLYGINDGSPDDIDWDETTVVYGDGTMAFPDAPGINSDQVGGDPTMPYHPGLESADGNSDDDIQDLDIGNLTLLIDNQPYGPQVEGDTYSFSSSSMADFINADTNGTVTFMILRALGDNGSQTSGNQARFASNTATQLDTDPNPLGIPFFEGPAGFAGPKLTIIPEPSSLLLLSLAGLALAGLRRNR